jgi:hypothetical protein
MNTEIIGTIRFINTMNVTRALVGRTFLNMPEGTNEGNAADRIAPYARSSSFTWGFAGTKENALLVVVPVKRGGSFREAGAKLNALLVKHGGAL